MNKAYIKSMLRTLLKKWLQVILATLAAGLLFACFGAYKTKKDNENVPKKLEEIEAYNNQIALYEQAAADAQTTLDTNLEQLSEYEKYLDSSIYMKIDPQNIETAQLVYSIMGSANDGSSIQALIAFINEGGLKADLDKEFEDLDIKLWKEIITCSQSGNNLNVTIIHYDRGMLEKIVSIVDKRLKEQVKTVAKTYENAVLKDVSKTCCVKAEQTVTNNQNNYRNTLKGYQNSKVDYENKVISCNNSLNTYIKNNEPENMNVHTASVKKNAVKYGAAGLVLGFIAGCALMLMDYIAGNRIKSAEDLYELGLQVLAEEDIPEGAAVLKTCAGTKELKEAKQCVIQTAIGDTGIKEIKQLKTKAALCKTEIAGAVITGR